MDAKQFAWLYLIENGYAGREPSYYGGMNIVDARLDKPEYTNWLGGHDASRELYVSEIKSIGVDWANTKAPESSMVSEFNGTFAEPSQKEYLKGSLMLKNGVIQHWTAEALEVLNVFEMMAQVHNAEKNFEALFNA